MAQTLFAVLLLGSLAGMPWRLNDTYVLMHFAEFEALYSWYGAALVDTDHETLAQCHCMWAAPNAFCIDIVFLSISAEARLLQSSALFLLLGKRRISVPCLIGLDIAVVMSSGFNLLSLKFCHSYGFGNEALGCSKLMKSVAIVSTSIIFRVVFLPSAYM